MTHFKSGQQGWFMGFRFTVIARRMFPPEMIYQIRFDRAEKYEYVPHSFLEKEKCFYFDPKTGDYIGKQTTAELAALRKRK